MSVDDNEFSNFYTNVSLKHLSEFTAQMMLTSNQRKIIRLKHMHELSVCDDIIGRNTLIRSHLSELMELTKVGRYKLLKLKEQQEEEVEQYKHYKL